jgi:hypothetical protein
VLRYAIKSHRGLLVDDDVPKDIYDNSRLPPPPRPGDIDVIVAGFPWYVSRVMLPASTARADVQGDHPANYQPAAFAAEHVSEG